MNVLLAFLIKIVSVFICSQSAQNQVTFVVALCSFFFFLLDEDAVFLRARLLHINHGTMNTKVCNDQQFTNSAFVFLNLNLLGCIVDTSNNLQASQEELLSVCHGQSFTAKFCPCFGPSSSWTKRSKNI